MNCNGISHSEKTNEANALSLSKSFAAKEAAMKGSLYVITHRANSSDYCCNHMFVRINIAIELTLIFNM